jgi:hypothetical protein
MIINGGKGNKHGATYYRESEILKNNHGNENRISDIESSHEQCTRIHEL